MTVLADFVPIELGEVIVGDGSEPGSGIENPFSRSFATEGRLPKVGGDDQTKHLQSFILLAVSGINTPGAFADVEINGMFAGRIRSGPGSVLDQRAAVILFDSAQLQDDAVNRITIFPVPAVNPTPDNQFDNFIVSNMVCCFRQES